MKINEQTQDISDLMQNFFKKKIFFNTTEPKKKRCNILMSTFVLFWGGRGDVVVYLITSKYRKFKIKKLGKVIVKYVEFYLIKTIS